MTLMYVISITAILLAILRVVAFINLPAVLKGSTVQWKRRVVFIYLHPHLMLYPTSNHISNMLFAGVVVFYAYPLVGFIYLGLTIAAWLTTIQYRVKLEAVFSRELELQ